MAALCAGLDGTPLVLIQGPPGTGKTRTITNLLSVVMHAAAKGSLELMPIAGGAAAAGAGNGAAATAVAAAAARAEGDAAAAAARGSAQAGEGERRHWLWALQSPWMFGRLTRRDLVGPWPRERTPPAGLETSLLNAGKRQGCSSWSGCPSFGGPVPITTTCTVVIGAPCTQPSSRPDPRLIPSLSPVPAPRPTITLLLPPRLPDSPQPAGCG
jgi:hypothetical protein